MSLLLYVVTRAMLALVALMSIDALAGTSLAADIWHVVPAFCLLAIAEFITEDAC